MNHHDTAGTQLPGDLWHETWDDLIQHIAEPGGNNIHQIEEPGVDGNEQSADHQRPQLI